MLQLVLQPTRTGYRLVLETHSFLVQPMIEEVGRNAELFWLRHTGSQVGGGLIELPNGKRFDRRSVGVDQFQVVVGWVLLVSAHNEDVESLPEGRVEVEGEQAVRSKVVGYELKRLFAARQVGAEQTQVLETVEKLEGFQLPAQVLRLVDGEEPQRSERGLPGQLLVVGRAEAGGDGLQFDQHFTVAKELDEQRQTNSPGLVAVEHNDVLYERKRLGEPLKNRFCPGRAPIELALDGAGRKCGRSQLLDTCLQNGRRPDRFTHVQVLFVEILRHQIVVGVDHHSAPILRLVPFGEVEQSVMQTVA